MRRQIVSTVVVIALSGFGASVHAAPITYTLLNNGASEFVITATITNSTLGLSNSQVFINGGTDALLSIISGSETIDASTPALDSFSFVSNGTGQTSSSGTYSLVANGANTPGGTNINLGTVNLSNATLALAGGNPPIDFSSGSGTPANPWAFSTPGAGAPSNVSTSAQFTFTAPGGQPSQPQTLSQKGVSFAGSIITGTDGSQQLEQTTGIELASMTFSSPTTGTSTVQLWLGDETMAGTPTDPSATVKNDVVFDGVATVPLPAGTWLLISGLGALALMRRRSLSAAQG